MKPPFTRITIPPNFWKKERERNKETKKEWMNEIKTETNKEWLNEINIVLNQYSSAIVGFCWGLLPPKQHREREKLLCYSGRKSVRECAEL